MTTAGKYASGAALKATAMNCAVLPVERLQPEADFQRLVHTALYVGVCPALSRRRRLSNVRTCSSSTTLSRVRPPVPALMPMWVGRFVLSCLDVIAAAITVGLWRLPTSFCTISTGRTPPCSLPTTGLRSA